MFSNLKRRNQERTKTECVKFLQRISSELKLSEAAELEGKLHTSLAVEPSLVPRRCCYNIQFAVRFIPKLK